MPKLRSTLLLALCAAVAPAQDKLNLGLSSREDGIVYQFQLRAVRAGGGLDPVVAAAAAASGRRRFPRTRREGPGEHLWTRRRRHPLPS